MSPALIDTDVLSELLKSKRRTIVDRGELYLREHDRLTFSAMTYYEVERGLLSKRAVGLLARFDAIAQASLALPITSSILKRAARLWAAAENRGSPHNDADLIIAATALEHELVLVTGNRRHFDWIADLVVESWD